MVHAEALTGPGGVVLDERAALEPFMRWAQAGKSGGAAVWMQINHPGRQVRAEMPGVVWGPSAVAVELGKHSKRFGKPAAMTEAQIGDTVERFATAAARAEQAGFDGVEVHAAHGYLLSLVGQDARFRCEHGASRHQMRRITRGKHPTGTTHPLHALICDQRNQRRALRRYRDWLERDGAGSSDSRGASDRPV